MARVDVDNTGLTVCEEDSVSFRIDWADVREIIAYYDACESGDCLCLGFRISDPPDYFRVDASMAGFERALAEIERQFPDRRSRWREQLGEPDGASKMLTVWGVPHPSSGEGFTEQTHV